MLNITLPSAIIQIPVSLSVSRQNSRQNSIPSETGVYRYIEVKRDRERQRHTARTLPLICFGKPLPAGSSSLIKENLVVLGWGCSVNPQHPLVATAAAL